MVPPSNRVLSPGSGVLREHSEWAIPMDRPFVNYFRLPIAYCPLRREDRAAPGIEFEVTRWEFAAGDRELSGVRRGDAREAATVRKLPEGHVDVRGHLVAGATGTGNAADRLPLGDHSPGSDVRIGRGVEERDAIAIAHTDQHAAIRPEHGAGGRGVDGLANRGLFAVGALQVTLRRLESKGFLKSKQGDTNETRRGRPKLFFEITAYGKKALDYSKESRDELWKALPKLVLKLK